MSNHIDSARIIPCPTPTNKNFENLLGRRFGRLSVQSLAGKIMECGISRYCWLCLCDCGENAVVKARALKNGTTKSCGCFQSEGVSVRNFRHGLCFSPEYSSWSAMLTRCNNPNTQDWKYYGGRGISVCERWKDFRNFEKDMGKKPSPEHSIDRINNEGNYEPENCVWSTPLQQARNRRPPHA